jgi:hypothetical protein
MDIVAFLSQARLLPEKTGYERSKLPGGFWNDVYRLRGNGRRFGTGVVSICPTPA